MRALSLHPKATAFVFGCVTSLIILGLVEVICRIWLQSVDFHKGRVEYSDPEFGQRDELLGEKPKTNAHIKAARTAGDGKVIWHAEYSTDSYGRRVTPGQSLEDKESFILFFGDSFVFGEGLNDDETLPYFVGKDAPCYHVYNYGVVGYGPAQMLARLQDGEVFNEIREPEGILVYCYMGEPKIGHIDRVICSLLVYDWNRYSPYYYLDGKGNLVRNGSFRSGRVLRSMIYRLLWHSAIVKLFEINYPLYIDDDHIGLTAQIIKESQRLFCARFKHATFCVVSFPGAQISTNKALIDVLRKAGIECLDYNNLVKMSGPEYRIPGDGHPTVNWNRELAPMIVKDLRLDKARCSKSQAPN